MEYTLYDHNFPATEQDPTKFTLRGLAFEAEWTTEEFDTIAKLAKGRSQKFDSITVTRVS